MRKKFFSYVAGSAACAALILLSGCQQTTDQLSNITHYVEEKIAEGNSVKKEYLGLIRFADMIPVPEEAIKHLEFRNYLDPYNMLLVKQYNYINVPENRKRIKEKATKLYSIINNDKENKTTYFYKKLCCNFKLLEEKLKEYYARVN